MTGYTVHTGSTEKFSQGWDQIFGTGQGSRKRSTSSTTDSKSTSAQQGNSAAPADDTKQTKGK